MFSLDRYREMNLLRIFGVPDFELSPTGKENPSRGSFLPPKGFKWGDSKKITNSNNSKVKEIFKGYYIGGVQYNYSLKTNSYNNLLSRITATPMWQGLISSATNNGMTASFGAPIKPYITGTEPMTFEFQCFLPIEDCFITNIENKIKNLLAFVLPAENGSVRDILNGVEEKYDSIVDWLFNKNDSVWGRMNDVFTGMYDKFVKGAYLLDTPLQLKNKTTIWVGNQRIYDVVITNVAVSFSPNFYFGRVTDTFGKPLDPDSGAFYPSYAIVKINCSTNNPVTRNQIDSMKFYKLPEGDNLKEKMEKLEKEERVSTGDYEEFQ